MACESSNSEFPCRSLMDPLLSFLDVTSISRAKSSTPSSGIRTMSSFTDFSPPTYPLQQRTLKSKEQQLMWVFCHRILIILTCVCGSIRSSPSKKYEIVWWTQWTFSRGSLCGRFNCTNTWFFTLLCSWTRVMAITLTHAMKKNKVLKEGEVLDILLLRYSTVLEARKSIIFLYNLTSLEEDKESGA